MNEQYFFLFCVSFLFIATRNHTVKVQMVNNNACSCWNKRGESNITVSWNLKFRNFTSIQRQLCARQEPAQKWTREKKMIHKMMMEQRGKKKYWNENASWRKTDMILYDWLEYRSREYGTRRLHGMATDDEFYMDEFISCFFIIFISFCLFAHLIIIIQF